MAIGRQDYQAGMVPIKSGYSLVQTPFFKNDDGIILAGEDDAFSVYTVPGGHKLCITGVRMASNSPGMQYISYDIDAVKWSTMYYDMLLIDNFPEGSPMIVNTGEEVSIIVYNNMEIDNWYFSNIIGFLEQIKV